MTTHTPAPLSPRWPGLRTRRRVIARAARPRYASVLPPPVGKKSRSTVSRSASRGSARPGTFSRMKASWKACQAGARSVNWAGSRCRRARATARFATRKASSTSASPVSTAMPRAMRSAASSASRSSSAAVSPRASGRVAISARRRSIHARYRSTSGPSAVSAAPPSGSVPRASIDSSAPGTPAVFVCSTSAPGIQAVRSVRQASSTMSQSADTPWPVAYSGCRRSGGLPPARPSRRPGRRAGRDGARTAGGRGSQSRPGRRRRGRGRRRPAPVRSRERPTPTAFPPESPRVLRCRWAVGPREARARRSRGPRDHRGDGHRRAGAPPAPRVRSPAGARTTPTSRRRPPPLPARSRPTARSPSARPRRRPRGSSAPSTTGRTPSGPPSALPGPDLPNQPQEVEHQAVAVVVHGAPAPGANRREPLTGRASSEQVQLALTQAGGPQQPRRGAGLAYVAQDDGNAREVHPVALDRERQDVNRGGHAEARLPQSEAQSTRSAEHVDGSRPASARSRRMLQPHIRLRTTRRRPLSRRRPKYCTGASRRQAPGRAGRRRFRRRVAESPDARLRTRAASRAGAWTKPADNGGPAAELSLRGLEAGSPWRRPA